MQNNTDILLMQPPHQQDTNVPYPVRKRLPAIACLAADLEKAGVPVGILNLNSSAQPASDFEHFDYLIHG
jgi:hypothetical protein